METKKLLSLVIVMAGLLMGTFTLLNSYQENSRELSMQRNYNFDIAIGNVAEPRQPTQYDIPVGVVQDAQGNDYKVYESRTIITNDFSKLFIGGRA